MTLITQTVPAETAAQTDLLRNSVHRLSSLDRMVNGSQFVQTSGTLTANTIVQLFVADVLIGEVVATTQAGALSGYALYPVDAEVPAGAELRAILQTAIPASSTAILLIEIDELMDDDQGAIMDEMLAGI